MPMVDTNTFLKLIRHEITILIICILIFSNIRAISQTIPVGLPGVDESLRVLQLEGKLDLKFSLSSRPFFTNHKLSTDSILKLIDSSAGSIYKRHNFYKGKAFFELLPFSFNNEFNSHHPYSWNHAGMIDAKGYQSFLSTGVYAEIGPLSIQLKPEFVYAANPSFEYSSQFGAPTKGTYRNAFWGQSSIRLKAGPISLGLSTENMWWGPGIQNSLLMSNNAPGFPHLILNTTYPIKTPVGNFEFQLIAGKLTEDTTLLLENSDLTTFYYNQGAYSGLSLNAALDYKSWRYINGISASYNPKWIKGLFLGINRVAYTYNDYLGEFHGFIHNYLPVFIGLFRTSQPGNAYYEGSKHLKQIISINGRYLLPQSHAEIYFEYGSNDNTANFRDLLMSPDHAGAFTVGFKKLLPIGNNKWIDFSSELSQLAQSSEILIRSTGYWYLYNGGYTNQSRIIGAGYGMGSNMQTVNVNLISGFKKLGFSFQRILHDPNRFNYSASISGGTTNVSWSDIALGFSFQKKIKGLVFYLQSQTVSSNNYAWINKRNPINFNIFSGVTYYWGR